ncbi:MAG: kelch repeat-containing protein [Verrucomicrobiota bacterium]
MKSTPPSRLKSINPSRSGAMTALFSGILLGLGFAALPTKAQAARAFFNTGQLAEGRNSHTATVLANGKVLLAGGKGAVNNAAISSAEIYDPATQSSVLTGSLAAPRVGHRAVLLPNGKVLVAGGIATAEIYNPATGTWQDASPLEDPFVANSCTVLANGKVLVVGGTDTTTQTAKAKLYDPQANSWTTTGSLATVQGGRSAVLLSDGRVLVAGGYDPATNSATVDSDVYNPESGAWTSTAPLGTARNSPNVQRLANGKVIAIGGSSGTTITAELFNPATGSWTTTGSLTLERLGFSAVALPDNTVLITGGFQNTNPLTTILASSEMYDPAKGIWKRVDSMNTLRCLHQATVLQNGTVLITGGWGYFNPAVWGDFNHGIRQSEIYKPVAGQWTAIAPMSRFHYSHATTLLADGKVLLTGGYGPTPDSHHPTGPVTTAEILDPSTGSWSETGEMASAKTDHTAILLKNGNVLAFGRYGGNAEIYAPATGSWGTAGSMVSSGLVAVGPVVGTILQDGKVIATGSPDGSAQLYDPAANAWSTTAPGGPQSEHTATLLSNGKILTIASDDDFRCAVFSPMTNTWSITGSPLEQRNAHSACLLPSGKVLMCGGLGYRNGKYGFPLTSAEIYDPSTGKWSVAKPCGKSRTNPSLFRIGDTRVMALGGDKGETSNTTEIYDEVSNTWAPTAPLLAARTDFSLASTPDGILAIGGLGVSPLPLVEIYDPPFPGIAVEQPVGREVLPSAQKDFGTVVAGSGKSLKFTVRNAGNSELTGLTLNKTGAHPGDFDLKLQSSAGLAPGSATMLTVAFNPTSPGNKSATLHLRFNDNGGSSFDIHLTGKAGRAPEIVVEQPAKTKLADGMARKNFGTLKVGRSGAAKTFTIRNTGTAILTDLAVRKGGNHKGDFTVGNLERTTLAPGASIQFKVTFKPGAPGTRDAALHLTSNDADENTFDITLTGNGARP